MNRSWILPFLALISLGSLFGCSDPEETLPQSESSSATASSSATDQSDTSTATSATVTDSATPDTTNTTSATPSWSTFEDPAGFFAIDYPDNWFERDGALYSGDPSTWNSPGSLPPEVAKVEIGYYSDDGISGCGVLLVDGMSGELVPKEGATATNIGGQEAWRLERLQGDPGIEGHLTRIEATSLIYQGRCVSVTGYFTQLNPDVMIVAQIVTSFRFNS